MRPKLSACFAEWWRDWQARQAKLAVLGAKGVQQETERERHQLAEELGRLKQVHEESKLMRNRMDETNEESNGRN